MEDKKLRVLVANDIYLPDVDGVVTCMTNYMDNTYKEIEYTAIVPDNTKKYIDKAPYRIIRCNSLKVPFYKSFYGFPKMDLSFEKEVMSHDYDLVHIHSPFNMGHFAVKIAKKKNIPIVFTQHSNYRMDFKKALGSNFIANIFAKKIGRLYNNASCLFACSPNICDMARSFGYRGATKCLPFGTELKMVHDIEPLRNEANKLLDIDERMFVGLFVGRLVPLKRVDFIIKSCYIVKKMGYDFRIFIVGSGVYKSNLIRLAKKLGLESNIIFLGFVDRNDLPKINARADLLLFPSLYDTFGLVKLEAAAYKTPGLFIEHSNVAYEIKDGVNGFTSANNTKAYARKIIEIIKNSEKLKEVGENAQKTLYRDWKEASKQLVEAYKEVVRDWNCKEK